MNNGRIRNPLNSAEGVNVKTIKLDFTAGYRTALIDGSLVPQSYQHMATELLYWAEKGASLKLTIDGYLFAAALYSPEREEKYIYTYDYEKESNWTSYDKNLSVSSYQEGSYIFEKSCYFRLCVKRKDGRDIVPEDVNKIEKGLIFLTFEKKHTIHKWQMQELDKVEAEVKRLKSIGKKKLVIGLLSDTHYTVNGTWEDTCLHIQELNKRVGLDAIVHLGDITDGLLSKKATTTYVKRVINDLKKNKTPVYIAVGNHDENYFNQNTDNFTQKEMIELYGCEEQIKNQQLYYYVDVGESLRCIFLVSFCSHRPVRYGFDKEQIAWLKDTLKKVPYGYRVIVFSHDAPLTELDYWSFLTWNGEELIHVLEEYQASKGRNILGLFHGHAHADFVYEKCSFPIISIGCAKCEFFTEMKPKGFYVPSRELNTKTQDLWDVMIVDTENLEIELVRFGAGNSRTIDCHKRKSTWYQEKIRHKETRIPKVWAHRGVSGHAPENTLPAFELAVEMNVDGVELDVQMTSDGELVVIHDETIDRVSDGHGYVKDYTLKQLRNWNYNRKFPTYGRVEIPTLQEVLTLLSDTKLLINLELKNNEIRYKGLEEKTFQLVEKMGLEERVLFSSFNHASMYLLKKRNKKIKTAFLYMADFMDMPEYARKYRMDAIHPWVKNLKDMELIERCHKSGIKVNTWTIDEQEDIKLAMEAGVDAIITNYPERVL